MQSCNANDNVMGLHLNATEVSKKSVFHCHYVYLKNMAKHCEYTESIPFYYVPYQSSHIDPLLCA